MARRRKTSLFDDLFTLATLLPWWASLLVALVSWYLLHGYATSPIPPVDPHRSDMTGAMVRGFAMVFQFIPSLLVFNAVSSSCWATKDKRLCKDGQKPLNRSGCWTESASSSWSFWWTNHF